MCLALAQARLCSFIQLKGDGRLELSFHSAELRAICVERDQAAAKLGYAAASELARILADIDAVDVFTEFSAMFGSRVSRAGDDKLRFRMKEGHSILFCSGLPQNLGDNPQPTDWSQVYRLMILAIEPTDE